MSSKSKPILHQDGMRVENKDEVEVEDEAPIIGLQKVKINASAHAHEVMGPLVGLKQGFILGRSSHKHRNPLKPDLGMTHVNAEQVSRHECLVEKVTSTSVTLFIPDKLFGNPKVYKPLIVRQLDQKQPRQTSPSLNALTTMPIVNQRFTLELGDILIFQTGQRFENHAFQITTMPGTQPNPLSVPSMRRSMPTTSNVATAATSSAPSSRPKRAASRSSISSNTGSVSNKVAKAEPLPPPLPPQPSRPPTRQQQHQQQQQQQQRNHHRLPAGEAPFICPFEATMHARLLRAAPSHHEPLYQEQQLQPECIAPTGAVAGDTNESSREQYSEEEDMDEEDAIRASTMHTTLGNTLEKALCESNTPTIGSTLFHLSTICHHRLPSMQLCQSLIQRITLVYASSTKGNESLGWTQKQLILEYLESFAAMHPTVARDRLAEGAGRHFWMDILNQLYTLRGQSRDTRQDEPSTGSKSTFALLKEHLLNLKFFYLVLVVSPKGGCPYPHPLRKEGFCHASTVREMDEYGGPAACRLAASTLAHFLCEFGHHVWLTEATALTVVVSEIVDYLGFLVRCMVHELLLLVSRPGDTECLTITGKSPMSAAEVSTLLWNVLSSRLEDSKQKISKTEKLKMKMLWLESLRWSNGKGTPVVDDELENMLAKKLRVTKEYYST